MRPGMVHLVGAGPGAPGLITEKGAQVLRLADVVLYDRGSEVLLTQYTQRETERIAIGGEKGWKLDRVDQVLVEKAQEGNRVACLTEGDPYISGLYPAVAESLIAHQIPFEVIPGIPALLAAPAYAGISVPRREGTLAMLSLFPEGRQNPPLPFMDHTCSRVFSGTGDSLSSLCKQLIQQGYAPDTPITMISQTTRPEQRAVSVTLAAGAEEKSSLPLSSSTVIYLGKGGRPEKKLSWFAQKPLFGRRILVTRAREQARELSAQIEALGGEALEFPVIRIAPPKRQEGLNAALQELSSFQWVVFTSVNGVKFFFQRLRQLKIDIRQMAGAKIAAVGPKTAEALEEKGIQVDLMPQEYVAESLVDELLPRVHPGDKVLLPRANIARAILAEELVQAGCEVIDVDAYDTRAEGEDPQEVVRLLEEGRLHVLTFTSSSTVRYFIQAIEQVRPDWQALLSRTQIVCIGPITVHTAETYGLRVDGMARSYTIDGLVEALIQMPRPER